MAELNQLQEQEIPAAMEELASSHANLKKVADYCEGLYLSKPDQEKPASLNETRQLTTQTLASVAYQINTLATSFLSLLDLQVNQLSEMESSINHLAQTVAIHKEKVARREIGVLTTNKSFYRPNMVKPPGIIFPEQQEKPVKYVRKAIDFTILDGIGHGGVKPTTQNTVSRSVSRSAQPSSVSSSNSSYAPPSSHINQSINAGGTLTRAGQYPRSAAVGKPVAAPGAPVAPPSVPSHYMSAQQLMQAQQTGATVNVANATYAQGHMDTPPPPPPMLAEPEPEAQMNGRSRPQTQELTPPPPPPAPQDDYVLNQAMHHQLYNNHHMLPYQHQSMPPPPPPDEDIPEPDQYDHSYIELSPVPPPPPPMDDAVFNGAPAPVVGHGEPAWAPHEYIEKVLAVFDYEPANDDELRFRENTLIYVIKKNSDGWWEGVMSVDDTPVCGLFPQNYVEQLY